MQQGTDLGLLTYGVEQYRIRWPAVQLQISVIS